MGKFIKGLKKALNSFRIQHNIIVIIILVLTVSPITAITSAALAGDNLQSGSAFLAVPLLDVSENDDDSFILNNGVFMAASGLAFASAPAKSQDAIKPANRKVVVVTAYSSTPDQTDSSPFITANGTRVYDGVIAANFLPFGAKVKFPEYSGDKIYTVEDRMAKKNNHKIDIWMVSRGAALNFGARKLAYEVIE